jgi:hypothetical protein
VASSRSSSASFSTDHHAGAWARVATAILESDGVLPAYVRRAIARGDAPPELHALAAKVRREAYRIVDRDIEGLDADTVYEVTLAAALDEAQRRRKAALRAIG